MTTTESHPMNDKAKIAALRDVVAVCRNLGSKAISDLCTEVLALTADASEQAQEKFTDAMYLAWDGFDNSMSCEERAAIYFAVRAVDPAAPVADTGAVTEGWLIEWTDTHGKRRKVCGHNCAGDYRAMYEGVTVTELVRRAPATPTATADSAADARDAVRLMFVMQDIDSFGTLSDKYDYAIAVASKNGRDEPTPEDELEGVRLLIDVTIAAMQPTTGEA